MSGSTHWKIAELKRHITELDTSFHRLTETVDSLYRATNICEFHVRQCRDLLAKFEHDSKDLTVLKRVLSAGEIRFEAEQEILAAEAHLVAAINAARSMFDVFSHLVNALLLNSKLSERSCSVEGVTKQLPPCELKVQLETLIDGYWYRYLVAFINTSKHRTLIPQHYRFNTEEKRGGIFVRKFHYNKADYDQQWAYEVLTATHELKNALPALGRTLNKELNVNPSAATPPSSPTVTFEIGP